MKKVLLVICALLMSSLFSRDILAKQTVSDTDAQIVQAFCQGSDLYAYVNLPKEKKSSALIVSALLDNTYSYQQSAPITEMSKTNESIFYLFLVDISTSMPGFKNNINTFVSDFMSASGDNVSFAVASFGTGFEVNCDFTKNQENIKTELDTLKYNVRQTSLYSSIISVVDYYNKKKRSKGELFNVIVITDGIEVDKDGVTSNEVEEKIKSSSVIVHTFGLPTKSNNENDKKTSEESLKVLGSIARASLGVHTILGYDDNTEADIAEEINGFVNHLYLTKFNSSNFIKDSGSHSIKLTFATTGEKGDLFAARGTVMVTEPEATPIPSITGGGKNNLTDDSEASIASNSGAASVAKTKRTCSIIYGIAILALAIVLLIAVSFVFYFTVLSKKRKKRATGIYMKLELLTPNYKLRTNEFYLLDELYIGRDKSCAIRLNSKDVSKRNSRVYVKDNIIYIEDLNSTNGTSISNMKIFSPNKLRSGDVISIGPVRLSFKF